MCIMVNASANVCTHMCGHVPAHEKVKSVVAAQSQVPQATTKESPQDSAGSAWLTMIP